MKLVLLLMIMLLARQESAAQTSMQQLPLTFPGATGTRGELMGPAKKICYNLTLSDKVVKEAVWWEQAKLILVWNLASASRICVCLFMDARLRVPE
jgi:hypothetical protein